MSEPRAHATRTVEVVPGIRRWSVRDDRIGGADSEAYAVLDDDGAVVLVDPLPLSEGALNALGPVTAIVLTSGCHQRSSWRLRRELKVPVWAPVRAFGLEDTPDFVYSGGDTLPGGLMAYHTPGPVESMYTLWRERPRGLVFISDLLYREGNGPPRFVQAEYQDEPWRTRESVRRVLAHLPVDIVCFAHGRPMLDGGAQSLQRALDEDVEHPTAPPA